MMVSFSDRLPLTLKTASCILILLLTVWIAQALEAFRSISRDSLTDKIRGGWTGKIVGVSYGTPAFRCPGRIDETPLTWSPEQVTNAFSRPGLYQGIAFSEMMDRLGFDATVQQYGQVLKSSEYPLSHATAAARRLLNQGIVAPKSGQPRYNLHANDIDFQSAADFIGLMTPGLPREANRLCERVGRVMNSGDGLYGGMWLDGMYCAAFFETDVRKVVQQGLASIPARSQYGLVIADILRWTEQEKDWRKVWRRIEDKWDKDDPCPDGAAKLFNIDAKLNGAYVALALLCGESDFEKTLEIALGCGQDSASNASSAAGVLGVIRGYNAIPDKWKSRIPTGRKFDYTHSSYDDLCRTSLERTFKIVRLTGGKVTDTEIRVPQQLSNPPKFEQWDMGIPCRRVGLDDMSWNWQGNWTDITQGEWENKVRIGVAPAESGSGVVLTFTGSAVAILGQYSESGGRADVYVDGKKSRAIDAFAASNTHETALWHAYGLAPGQHTVRIVAKGNKLVISEAIIFQSKSQQIVDSRGQ